MNANTYPPDRGDVVALIDNRRHYVDLLNTSMGAVTDAEIALMTAEEKQRFLRARVAVANAAKHLTAIHKMMTGDD